MLPRGDYPLPVEFWSRGLNMTFLEGLRILNAKLFRAELTCAQP